ncbi:aminodeoxychorismate lyase [Calderihabitans maritimus]|uniref:Endolytic murein transglycosylase n=1 Tax=Calderihabitans maritimus TaxID=1246530 RepID=A0A1Z5HY18_9FIRM|nr:aminodeoxychorismate lyase [Calderihabitans maritimus]
MAEAPAAEVAVFIRPGSTAGEIARLLREKEIIRSKVVFELYARIKNLDKNLQAGEYIFSPNQSVPEIVAKLVRGDVKTYSFTIPEGYTVEQIASMLAKMGLVDEEKFLQLAREGDFPYSFLQGGENANYRLEGFLFPDTYNVPKGLTEEKIIELMLRRFAEVYTPELRRRATYLGFTDREIITLASIIEKEAKLDAERPLVSAVFHNRLERNMRLQSCATVQYLLEEPKEVLTYDDLNIESPYNTYRHEGLPPGPIGSPGRASIEAALYPSDVPYLYFVAKKDGSHIFSTTLTEHNRAKAKYLH